MGTSAAAAAARAHAAIQDDIVSNAPTFFRQACKLGGRSGGLTAASEFFWECLRDHFDVSVLAVHPIRRHNCDNSADPAVT
jgi:hypothetical protein